VDAFYYGLPNNIRTLVEKRNDLSPIEMYKMIEKANQELEVRYESQQAYISSRTFGATSLMPPESAFRKVNGEINETIVAGMIRANNLTINPYLAIQTIN